MRSDLKKEDQLLMRRFCDLSRQAYQKNIVVFSDFLNMYEIHLLYQGAPGYDTSFSVYGGYEYAERQMVSFQPDALYYEWEYPIVCLEFVPRNRRFAEELSHRDVLGALMHLGIDRSKTGDILVEDERILIFCTEGIADFILDELRSIRHTQVTGKKVFCQDIEIHPRFEPHTGFVASNRLDAFVAEIFRLSRTKARDLLLGEKVFVNSRCITDPSFRLSEQDILSVRGFGKVIFDDFGGQSRKGRLGISYRKYV